MPQNKQQDIIDSGHVTKIELELEEAPDDSIPVGSMPPELDVTAEINSTYPDGVLGPDAVVVRAEEALIVILVLFLWAAAIALFFNRWGKIRMLEPYQPKFQQQHRPSCTTIEQNQLQNRRTYSKCNVLCGEYPVRLELNSNSGEMRPRQNSVFIGTSSCLLPGSQGTPRRTKSALDLQFLVFSETNAEGSGEQDAPRSFKPASESTKLLQRERKTSICQFDRNEAMKPSFRDRGMSICQFDAAPKLWQRDRGMSICQFDTSSKLWQRDRGMSICQFDRMDVLARPLQRDRGGSICQFDRMDVLARPLQRDRVGSAYHFDRTEVLAKPNFSFGKSLPRERRVSMCNFLEKDEEAAKAMQKERRSSMNVERIPKDNPSIEEIGNDTEQQEIFAKCTLREKKSNIYQHDQPSCSKTADLVYGYKATCV
ncbi:uncharacterized protein LOC117601351 isoform X1 [Osmia lignaria lignaria]|uniref:uncharacterized protein LOC117601351 isoform X1 n=1 Tax=Osmia lignaria lignaria TaxID=1437193 RepID=UPI001478137E|nr:uncharacterized protein LOC117601351 isoform X1 [Osmia lignaria]